MTSTRILRAFHLPADERIQSGVYTEQLDHLKQRADIKWMEVVRTQFLHDHGAVMVVDEEGHDKGKMPNRRAQFLSGYPLEHAIVGDVLFFSEHHDPMEGADLVDLHQSALDRYFLNKEVRDGYAHWLFSDPVRAFSDRHGLFYYRPKKKCPGHNPPGGAGSEEPGEPDFCDGSCITTI